MGTIRVLRATDVSDDVEVITEIGEAHVTTKLSAFEALDRAEALVEEANRIAGVVIAQVCFVGDEEADVETKPN